jgi:hypothetical protein
MASDMLQERFEYKGYTIVPMPVSGDGETWFGGYEIMKNGEKVRKRTNIFPGFFYVDAAHNDSVERAKAEIDNWVH